MDSTLLVALTVGLGLGVFLQKGRFCFVHAFRDLFAFKDTRVTKGVLAATTLTMVFWSIAYSLGYYQGFWTPGWGLTGLFGGFVFGVGMTYAGGCATGTLYRAGQGYLHFWLTLLFMGVGYVAFTVAYPTLRSTYFAPLTFGEGVTLFEASPIPAPALALLIAAGVDAGSFEYWGSVLFRGAGVTLTVDMVMIAAVIGGAFLASVWSGDFSIRVPKRRRLPNAVFGGFLMGAGSRLAPGCNIGNIYSGLAELSVHSFIATVGILAGVYVMTHWLYRDVGCAI